MTKEEAIIKMDEGKRVKHTLFRTNESIKSNNDRYYWQNGNSISCNAFWSFRTGEQWLEGWSVADDSHFTKFTSLPDIDVPDLAKQLINEQIK